MRYSELARKLRHLGCYPTRFGAGSHEIWRNPTKAAQTSIPYHGSKEIGSELVYRILRQLRIDREDFDQA